MYRNLIFCFLLTNVFTVCSLKAQQQQSFHPLQLDFNLLSIGLKTTYQIKPIELNAGVGYGMLTVSALSVNNYYKPVLNQRSSCVPLPAFYRAFYWKIGALYRFGQQKEGDIPDKYFYGQLQYIGYFKARNMNKYDEKRLGYQNRLALKAGHRKYLNKKHSWSFNVELGLALWANYNLSFISAGPQLNINFIGDIL